MEPSSTTDGNAKWRHHCGQLWQLLRKVNREPQWHPVILAYLKELTAGTQTKTCPWIFLAALATIGERQKTTFLGGWMDKTSVVHHTMGYYSAMNRKEVWAHPQNILLRERRRTNRSQVVWFHLCETPTRGKSEETEHRFVVARGWGRGRRGAAANGHRWFLLGWGTCAGTGPRWYSHNITDAVRAPALFCLRWPMFCYANVSQERQIILCYGLKGTLSSLASKILMDNNTCRSESKPHLLSAVYSVLSTECFPSWIPLIPCHKSKRMGPSASSLSRWGNSTDTWSHVGHSHSSADDTASSGGGGWGGHSGVGCVGPWNRCWRWAVPVGTRGPLQTSKLQTFALLY